MNSAFFLQWLLVGVSAVCCAAPAYVPSFLWWLNIVGYVLFMSAWNHRPRFLTVYVWLCVFIAVYTMPLFLSVLPYAHAAAVFFVALGTVLGMALPAACIFVATSRSRVLACCALMYYLVWYSLWFFGYSEGFWCLHPLVVWMAHPVLLSWVPWWGVWGATLHYFCFVYAVYERKIVVCLALLVPWVSGFFGQAQHIPPSYIHSIAAVQLPYVFECSDVHGRVEDFIVAAHHIVLDSKTSISLIIAPESTFPFCLNKHKAALAMMHSVPCSMLVGAYHSHNASVYNSAYFFSSGQCSIFDKTHLMFFIERIPLLCVSCMSAWTWLHNFVPFERGVTKRPLCTMNFGTFSPVVCSELFMQDHIESVSQDTLVCALVNDAWFLKTTIPDLLYYSVALRSLAAGIFVVYVSYSRAVVIDKKGFSWPLCKSVVT